MRVTATAEGEVAIFLSVEEAKACQHNPTTQEFRFFVGDGTFTESFHIARINAEFAKRAVIDPEEAAKWRRLVAVRPTDGGK